MADLDSAAMSAALLEYFDEQKLTDLLMLESPMLAMIRRGKFLGRGIPIPMVTDPGQASMSGTFATANTNRAPAKYKRFLLEDPGRIYAIGSIDRDIIDLAQTPRAAFADVQVEVDSKLRFIARELAHTLFRSRNAVCGVIASYTEDSPAAGQTTIVVEDPTDIANLGEGANLVASATAAGALRAATAYPVVSVVHSTGTIVVTGTVNATSGWDVGDSLHREGSAPNGGDPIYPSGFEDWLVGANVSATTFYSVDRSVNPELLSGTVVSLGSSSIREAISALAAKLRARGGKPGMLWVNPLKFQELEMELDGVATVEKIVPSGGSPQIAAQIGFNVLRVAAGNGHVSIASDPLCRYSRGHMLDMSTWSFLEIGGKRQPRLRDMHGGQFLQLADADAVKFQGEAKGDLACSNPAANGSIDFSS